ncbi:MAG: hypothetical protein HYV09_03610 [Deltaproteobacteria bacterium]|nr:hypothetical protein [Deltaproteobacteria bacterium]
MAAALAPSIASASEFDTKAGVVRFAPDAVKTWKLDSAAELIAASAFLTKFDTTSYPPRLRLTKVTDASMIESNFTAPSDAVEGVRAFRVGSVAGAGTSGLAIMDEAAFAALATSRIEISMWARAEGAMPALVVQYAKSDWSLESGFDFASAFSTRTGRETSDGWVEFTTGPIDGSVWGVPIRAIVLSPSPYSQKGTAFAVDAIEVRKVPGPLTAPTACTQADVDKTCGPSADCMYGRCVPSTVTWGPLPTGEHRVEFADRWTHIASHLIGDRASSEYGRKVFTPAARDLSRYSVSSRQFFGGMNRLVNGLRDNHTSFGSPPAGFATFGPMLFFGWSGALHACFGVVEKDLTGGGLGFGVFHAGDKPISGVPLKQGDMLVAIDGQDPKEWADAVIPGINRTSPNDPKADPAAYAELLSAAISARAKEIKVARCASATACTGDNVKEITIDVASKVSAHVLANGGWGDLDYFGCSPRFRDSVADFDEASSGEDTITPRTVDGIVNVQFDGFSGQEGWQGKMSGVFEPKPAAVLMDARQGNGGYGNNVEHLLGLLRGKDQRIGFITVVNGTYDEPSPSSLFTTYEKCVGGEAGFSFSCFGAWGFFSDLESPPGAATKIAWLNTVDVSANDYMPRLLAGRTGFRIFAPHPTAGAFGAVTSFSSFMPGWGGGSLQYQDSRFGSTYAELSSVRWESGHGVAPDVVVAQKVSDALNGKDTMLEAARAWLKAE